jgi:hypothetical protein
MHDTLLKIVRRLETDYVPFGKTEHDGGSDCSCGCRHFVKLTSEVGSDWGICANPESTRVGLLTFEHQGCTQFEPMTVERSLTDAQLRHLIGEASQILQDRRRDRIDAQAAWEGAPPLEHGEFVYEVRTSYSPHIKGHFPTLFRLELHDGGFTAIPLEARVGGNVRPTVKGRFPAKNGDVFKIVRENGEYSYQVPFSGALYNLKQYGDLSRIGVGQIEPLRPFFEAMEPDVFDMIVTYAKERLEIAKHWLEEAQDRLERWQRREFRGDEIPKSKREYREMMEQAKESVEEGPTGVVEDETFLDWLNWIDRSNPTLNSIACPPAPQKRVGKT